LRGFKKSLVAIVLLLLPVISGCGAGDTPTAAPKSPAPALVQTTVLETTEVTTLAESVGTLLGKESVVLTAKVTEQVSAVHFNGGELVQQGQVLVELIDAEQLALLHEAEANLRESELQLERLQTLGKEIATAAETDVAAARVDANAARLEALRSRIRDRAITAPFAGVVGFRRVSVGALVTPGTVIAELDDINPLKLEFTLPEHFLSQIDLGDTVRAVSTAWDDESFVGEVSQIGSRIDPVTRAFTVRALIANDDARLRPGMLMSVQIALGKKTGLVIPESALMQAGAQSSVYVVEAGDVARRVSVDIGQRQPGTIEVISGLKAGDRVVVQGQLGLRDGASVREAVESD
jgi:membrane fusion protein (multidrug efflux system)